MSKAEPARRLAVGALACALLVAAVAPAVGIATGADSEGSTGEVSARQGPELVEIHSQQRTPSNGTVRHEDPDAVDRQGDLADVERYLAGKLRGRLAEGSVAISQGEYEAARSVLGAEYDGQLARYVDVAGETENGDDDAAAETFRAAGNRTRSYADDVRSFEETYDAYRRASDRGDETQARTLARELVATAQDVDQTGARLQGDYVTLANRTGQEFSGPRERVRNTTRTVTERAETVAAATFVRTELDASVRPSTVSFLQPATVRGRLVDENGTTLANRTVLVGAAGEAVRTETNASGRFAATYRPVQLPIEPGRIPLRYEPENTSVYLGDRTNVSVAVEPVTPTVAAEVEPDSAAFGDRLRVTGGVEAEGVPASGAPIVVSVDGVRLGRAQTDDAGEFSVDAELPADVLAGSAKVEVRVDQSGRALARATATTPLEVESTATTLTIRGSFGEDGTAIVSGRLRTVDGRGVRGRPIRLSADGSAVRTVETDGSGQFSARLDGTADGDTTVEASFEGTGTNLETSRAATTLQTRGGGVIERTEADDVARWWWVAVLVGVALLVGRGIAIMGNEDEASDDTEGATGASEGAGATEAGMGRGMEWRKDATSLLEAGDSDGAVARAYGAVRGRLAEELDASGALTHWEFYAAASEDGIGDAEVEALLALTETYEHARYAPRPVSGADADAAVAAAEELLAG